MSTALQRVRGNTENRAAAPFGACDCSNGGGFVQPMRIDLDNHIRGVLKAFGLKVGKVATGQFEARVARHGPLDLNLLMGTFSRRHVWKRKC